MYYGIDLEIVSRDSTCNNLPRLQLAAGNLTEGYQKETMLGLTRAYLNYISYSESYLESQGRATPYNVRNQ
jgi:hypothetical protein